MYEKIAQVVTRALSASENDSVVLRMMGFISLRDQDPVSPNKAKLLTMGLMLSLGLGLGVPFLLQSFRTSSSTLNEL
jgi:hypothetical protein